MADDISRYPLRLSTSPEFREGFFAFRDAIREEYNPFPFGTAEYQQWRNGWYAAKRERLLDWRTITTAILLTIVGVMSAIPQLAPSPFVTGLVIIITAIASVALRVLSGGQIAIKVTNAVKTRLSGGDGR